MEHMRPVCGVKTMRRKESKKETERQRDKEKTQSDIYIYISINGQTERARATCIHDSSTEPPEGVGQLMMAVLTISCSDGLASHSMPQHESRLIG